MTNDAMILSESSGCCCPLPSLWAQMAAVSAAAAMSSAGSTALPAHSAERLVCGTSAVKVPLQKMPGQRRVGMGCRSEECATATLSDGVMVLGRHREGSHIAWV